jgi:hypothetical protein
MNALQDIQRRRDNDQAMEGIAEARQRLEDAGLRMLGIWR